MGRRRTWELRPGTNKIVASVATAATGTSKETGPSERESSIELDGTPANGLTSMVPAFWDRPG